MPLKNMAHADVNTPLRYPPIVMIGDGLTMQPDARCMPNPIQSKAAFRTVVIQLLIWRGSIKRMDACTHRGGATAQVENYPQCLRMIRGEIRSGRSILVSKLRFFSFTKKSRREKLD
jgi:hypothetical protein